MNINSLSMLIAFAQISLAFPAVAVFIYLKDSKNTLNKTFALYLCLIAWWSFFTIFLMSASESRLAVLWNRICLSSVVFIPSSFFHFIASFTDQKERLSKLVNINYGASLIFLLVLWFTPYFAPDVAPRCCVAYWTVPGPVYFIFIIYFIFLTSCSLTILWKFCKTSKLETAKQARYLLCFSILAYCGGACNYLVSYNLCIPIIIEFSNYAVLLLSICIAVIVFRYRFLDPEAALAIHRDKLALIGLLSSSVSHELKNPLFLIQEYIRKITAVPALTSDSTAREAMSKLSQQAERIDKLVKRLNDFSKPYNNSSEASEVNLAEAIENALFFASQELKYHNISTVINIDPVLPKVRGDRGEFEEIFLNLIVNAFHAMPDGGKLTIDAHTADGGKGIEISIQDTGLGIPPEQLGNIFKPFYTTKSKTGSGAGGVSGTGLGLYIVKNLVEKNGGRVWVSSKINKGSIFLINFNIYDQSKNIIN